MHPADEPDPEVRQPVVVLEKMRLDDAARRRGPDRLTCVERLEGAAPYDEVQCRPGRAGRPLNEDPARPYSCDRCPARFKTKQTLVVHYRVHTGEKPFACSHCPLRFRHSSSLASHELGHKAGHKVGLPLVCERCGGRFRLQKALAAHMREVHHVERMLKCGVCKILFATRSALQQHTAQQHAPPPQPAPTPAQQQQAEEANKSVPCYVCDKEFSSNAAMWAHTRFHGSGDRFSCRSCQKHFTSWMALRKHLRTHNQAGKAGKASSLLKCKMCPMRFAARSQLLTHLKTHDRMAAMAGDKLYYRCSKCLERFVGRKSLHAHLKTHREEEDPPPPALQPEVPLAAPAAPAAPSAKVYPCETCPLVFEKYKSKWNHRKVCPGAAPKVARLYGKAFACGTCGLRFKTRKLLYWHRQTHGVKAELQAVDDDESTQGPQQATQQAPQASPQKVFRCGKCSQPFPDRRALFAHSKTHSGAMVVMNPDDAAMPEAPVAPNETGDVADQMTPQLDDKFLKNSMRCSRCSKRFAGRKALYAHLKEAHGRRFGGSGSTTPATTPATQTTPATTPQATSQDDSAAADAKAYRCRKCPEVFPDKKSQMLHHEMVHTAAMDIAVKVEADVKAKKYRCTKCPEVFVSKKQHWEHYKEHAPEAAEQMRRVASVAQRSLKCGACAQEFEDRMSLWWHFREHMEGEEKVEDTCVEVRGDLGKNDVDPLATYVRCSLCPAEFPGETEHWQHYKEVHLADRGPEWRPTHRYRCTQCSETFPDEGSHWRHFRVHADEPLHKKYAMQKTNQDQYRCASCSEVFDDLESQWWHYKAHADPEHADDGEHLEDPEDPLAVGTFPCASCSECFPDKRSRWWHERDHAPGVSLSFVVVARQPGYRCLLCSDRGSDVFADEDAHWDHYRRHYQSLDESYQLVQGELQLQCDECCGRFEDEDSYWEHYRVHCDEELCHPEDAKRDAVEYRCLKCDQLSHSLETHWWHYRSHTVHADVEDDAAEQRCSRCEERFNTPAELWWHFRQHVEEDNGPVCEEVRSKQSFPCAKCEEVFPDRRSRFLHSAIHVTPRAAAAAPAPSLPSLPSGEWGYQCTPCKEIFLDTQSHWWHYKTVHGADAGPGSYEVVELTDDPGEDPTTAKRYQCSKCGDSFPDLKAHRRHWKQVHEVALPAAATKPPPKAKAAKAPSKAKGFHCSKCPEVFRDRKSHFHHYRAAHTGTALDMDMEDVYEPKNFNCSQCPEVFPDRESHWWHYRVHCSETEAAAVEVTAEETPGERATAEASLEAASEAAPETSEAIESTGATEAAVDGEATVASEATEASVTDKATEATVAGGAKAEITLAADGSTTAALESSPQFPRAKEYRCSKCPEVFHDLESHWWHYRIHVDPEFSASINGDAAHEKGETSGRFHCTRCPGSSFPDRRAHWAHVKDMHRSSSASEQGSDTSSTTPSNPPAATPTAFLTCGSCPLTFTSVKKLQTHEKRHADDGVPKPFKCHLCPQSFRFNINLFNHIKIHGQRAAGSEASPSAATGLSTELAVAAQPAATPVAPARCFKCPKCPARFKARHMLWAHSKTRHASAKTGPAAKTAAKTAAKPAPPKKARLDIEDYPCDKCEAVFATSSGLSSHQRVHADVKPFSCQQCRARFTLSSNLLRHMKLHNKVSLKASLKALVCCRQQFSSLAAKKEHVRTAHPPRTAEC
ncbi:zinc finger protein Xfin-like isoform X2 [Thrips palmi]|nr:zinc finger protein Xfin-like isoform X2 [Thrips palmi]